MILLFIPSTSSAEKVKADKNVAAPLKELGLRVSKLLVSRDQVGIKQLSGGSV